MRIRNALGRHRADLLAVAILVLGITLFHGRGLRPGQTFLPVDLAQNHMPWRTEWVPLQNWLISDPLYETYPYLSAAVNSIRQDGRPLLWNPNVLMGHPALADPLSQTFYPVFAVLGVALGIARGLAVGLWLQVLLAAFLTYGLLRTLGCTWRAALLGAFTYALSGYLVTWLETTFFTSTLTWFPGVLWAFELAVRKRRLGYAALAALTLALATLGGQFQFVMVFCLFLGLYALGRTIEAARRHERLPGLPMLVLLITVLAGALVGAIQTVPFAEYLALTTRGHPFGLTDPLPWQQFVTLIVSRFYGSPVAGGPYRGALNFSEGTIYAGVVALLLAVTAVFSTRRFFVLYLALLGLAAVYFIAGGPGVALVGRLPLLNSASLHRSAFLLPLIVAMLAAIGLSEPRFRTGAILAAGLILTAATGVACHRNWQLVGPHWSDLRSSFLLAAAFLVAAIVLLLLRTLWARSRSIVDLALVGLVFLDLFLAGSRYNPAGPIERLFPVTPDIEFLKSRTGLERVMPVQVVDNSVLYGPTVLSIFGIPEVSGDTSLVSAPLHWLVAAADPVLEIPWMGREGTMMTYSHPPRRLLDLLGVGYVASEEPLADPGIRAERVAEDCAGDGSEILATRPLSGTFTVRDAAINRLDLRFRVDAPTDPGDALMVRLWRETVPRTPVLESRLDLASIVDREPITFYFSPERDAPGLSYTWEVATESGSDRTGVALCTGDSGDAAVSVYGADGAQVYEGAVFVFERFSPLPRAYVAYASEAIPDDAVATERLLDEAFDLRNVVVAPDALGFPATPALPATRAQVTTLENERVVVKAAAKQQGILVLNDAFHPGWRVTVDGEPAQILRVNQIMRGVILPPGEHEVEFRFAPRSLAIGAGMTALGLLILAFLFIIDRLPKVARWLRP
jgi:Bacterial membrane protein YfhO